MKASYIALTNREDIVRWLQSSLGPDAEIAAVDPSTPERALQLADITGASVAFVLFTPDDELSGVRMVERLLSEKPYLAVVAVADTRIDRLILAAIRAGAQDYLTVGCDPVEVQGTISRLLNKIPTISTIRNASKGQLFSVLCARPSIDSATLAVHLALAMRERIETDRQVLLLDLGIPVGDTLLYLDMKPSYTFIDALRSVRRLDETLIKSAFARHSSGLTVLTTTNDNQYQQINVSLSDALVLLGILQGHFDVIVANLGGMPHADFLARMVDRSERALLLVEQSVASINASSRLLHFLVEHGVNQTGLALVVDRYLPKLELSAEKIAEFLSLPLLTTLPSQGLERLKAMNLGYDIFKDAPNSPYSHALKRLATELSSGKRVSLERHGGGLLERFFGGFGKRS